jgi:hypothetical protein
VTPGADRGNLLAIFAEPEPLLATARDLKQRGARLLDAFTPFPVPGLDDVLDARASWLPWIVLAGGILGAVAAYGLILYSVLVDYPINVGGRPLNAWPAYVVLAFEGGILGAALAGFFAMLVLNRLPTYHHAIFDAPGFSFGGEDRFYLLVAADGDGPAESTIRKAAKTAGALVVERVPP